MGQENQPEAVKVLEENEKQGVGTATILAIVFSAVWVGGLGVYAGFHICELFAMEPNEFGDFLAGTVSPLALIWLVAGYWQQGRDLRLNTRALEAQLAELALQVKATQELGESAKKQAEIAEENHQFDKHKFDYEAAEKREAYKKKINPVFSVEFHYAVQNLLLFRFFNHGGEAFRVELDKGDFEQAELSGDKISLKKDIEKELTLTSNLEMINRSRDFSVTCLYIDKKTHEFKYTVIGDEAGKITVVQNFDV